MNSLDIALAVILLFFIIRGIFRGFIKEVTSLVGVVVGFAIAMKYYPLAADLIKPFVPNPTYRQSLGFIIAFLASYIAISLLGLLLDLLFKLTLSKAVNGILGAFLALIKGLVLAAVVLMATSTFLSPESPFYKKSYAWPYLRYLATSLREMVPEDLKKAFENKMDQLPDKFKPRPGQQPPLDGPSEPAPWKPVGPSTSTTTTGPGQTQPPAWPTTTSPPPPASSPSKPPPAKK